MFGWLVVFWFRLVLLYLCFDAFCYWFGCNVVVFLFGRLIWVIRCLSLFRCAGVFVVCVGFWRLLVGVACVGCWFVVLFWVICLLYVSCCPISVLVWIGLLFWRFGFAWINCVSLGC